MKNAVASGGVLSLLIALFSCKDANEWGVAEEADLNNIFNEIADKLAVSSFPYRLNFEKSDTINFRLFCEYNDAAFDCGAGELRFVVDDTFNLFRAFQDSAYGYEHCYCGDVIKLGGLGYGSHKLNGNLSWHRGGYSFSKDWQLDLIIE